MQDIIRKRQPSEGEKISVHNASDKVLISKIYKTLTKLINNKKNPTAPHKWGEMKRQFIKKKTDGKKAYETVLIVNHN